MSKGGCRETHAENFPGQRNCSTAVAPHLVHGRTDVQSRSERIGGCHHASDVVSAQLPRRPFAGESGSSSWPHYPRVRRSPTSSSLPRTRSLSLITRRCRRATGARERQDPDVSGDIAAAHHVGRGRERDSGTPVGGQGARQLLACGVDVCVQFRRLDERATVLVVRHRRSLTRVGVSVFPADGASGFQSRTCSGV
jgi:hypothetical protein